MFGLCPIQKNGAIQKDLVADNEWSPYKCRCDIFVVWAPFKGLFLLVYSRRYPKYSRPTLLPLLLIPLSPCVVRNRGRQESIRLRALSLPRLQLGSGASIAIGRGGAGIYFRPASALHL